MNNFKFTYEELSNLSQEEQTKAKKTRCGVLAVECLNKKQLEKKKPLFMVFLDTIVFDSSDNTRGQYATATVPTTPLGGGRFKVKEGWGQLSNGIIELVH
nr:MAG TPA: hypothetical protein [Herelleviridae sp.]